MIRIFHILTILAALAVVYTVFASRDIKTQDSFAKACKSEGGILVKNNKYTGTTGSTIEIV